MNWELVKECIDTNTPNQSKGNKGNEGSKAVYYLRHPHNTDFSTLKYDADCVKVKLGHKNRIGDSFFRIISKHKKINEGFVEKLILVETKGKQEDYFEQLEQSLTIFDDFNGNIHGRFIGYNVPSIFPKKSKERVELDRIIKVFQTRNGTYRIGNKRMWEEIKNFEFTEIKVQNEKAKVEKINL